MSFTVDGVEWPVEAKISRTSEVRDSELSGLLLDGSYFHDVLGTYLRYDVEIVVPFGMEAAYSQLYEILNDPVDAHSFVLPYNQSRITVTGKVESVQDLRYPAETGHYWAGTKFSVVANHPSKFLDLGQVLTRGGAPLPDLNDDAPVGEVWRKDGTSGWVRGEYDDVDDVPY